MLLMSLSFPSFSVGKISSIPLETLYDELFLA